MQILGIKLEHKRQKILDFELLAEDKKREKSLLKFVKVE